MPKAKRVVKDDPAATRFVLALVASACFFIVLVGLLFWVTEKERIRVKPRTAEQTEQLQIAREYLNRAVPISNDGKDAEAEPLYRKALEIREKYLEPTDHQVIVARSDLASCLADQERYREAEEIAQKTLAPAEKTDDRMLFLVLETLGRCEHFYHNNLPKAEAYYKRALAANRGRPGASIDEDKAVVLYRLGALYSKQLKYADSEASYRECVQLREQFLDKNSLVLANSRYGWAVGLLQLNNHTEAEPQFAESARVLELDPGSTNLDRAHALWGLGNCQFDRKDYAQARLTYNRALNILHKTPNYDLAAERDIKVCLALCSRSLPEEPAKPPMILLEGSVRTE